MIGRSEPQIILLALYEGGLLEMPNTKLTREKLKVHFHYSRMIYLIVVVLAVLAGNLVYTMTEYRAPNERRVDIELIGAYADTSSQACKDAVAQLLAAGQEAERTADAEQGIDVTAEGYECALQEVQFLTVEYDDTSSDSETSYYGYQKYMVTLAAQEGDIYILSRRQLIELVEQNAVVPLDGYIERGVIDPGDRDLGNVTFDEYDDDDQTTGERHVYALQASSLTGLNDALSFNPEGKYMAIVRFSKNPDTAAAVMQEMIELFETPADEAEAQ